MIKEVTFDEIRELCPELGELYRLAKMIGDDKTQPYFCANFIWYGFMKPILVECVGLGRGYSEPRRLQSNKGHIGKIEFRTAAEILEMAPPKKLPKGFTAEDEKMLQSCAAYDVAYRTIYDALPDCRHENEICW